MECDGLGRPYGDGGLHPLPDDLKLRLTAAERDQLSDYEARRGGADSATHYSVPDMLAVWRAAIARLGAGDYCVDDYTGAVLLWRDRLESVLTQTPSPLSDRLSEEIATIDEAFRAATTEDVTALLHRFHDVDSKEGWWWRRIPLLGSIRRELDRAAQSD